MKFPVWSRAVSAQGTVKESLGDVNLPLVIAGQLVNPGDVVVADDDGVVIVARGEVRAVTAKSREREDKEAVSREKLSQRRARHRPLRHARQAQGARHPLRRQRRQALRGQSDADRHPLRDDARRHLQGRLFPGLRPARRHRRARPRPAGRDGLARPAPDRRHRRRRPAHQQGRHRLQVEPPRHRRRLPVRPGVRRQGAGQHGAELRQHPRRRRPRSPSSRAWCAAPIRRPR